MRQLTIKVIIIITTTIEIIIVIIIKVIVIMNNCSVTDGYRQEDEVHISGNHGLG